MSVSGGGGGGGSGGAGLIFLQLEYNPGLQSSGDLEPGTKNINWYAKPANPTYTVTHTIPTPPTGLEIMRLGVRIGVNDYVLNGLATVLNWSLERNGVVIGSGQFTFPTNTGAETVIGTLSGAAVYDLYLWTDADSVDVNEVHIDVGIGSAVGNGSAISQPVLRVTQSGMATAMVQAVGILAGLTTYVNFWATDDPTKVVDGSFLVEGFTNTSPAPAWTPYRGAPAVFVNPSYLWICGDGALADGFIAYLDKMILNIAH